MSLHTPALTARDAMLDLRDALGEAGLTLAGLGIQLATGTDYPAEHVDLGSAPPAVVGQMADLIRKGAAQ
ncbi:hypothetical protein GCM10027168_17930 [Streptomyces capparidis]